MRFYLLYDTSKEYKIEGECQVGRRQGDLILGDELLSGIHGKFYVASGKLFVMDLGSTNGTFINKKKIPPKVPMELNIDDEITMGAQSFRIRSKESTVITFTGELKVNSNETNETGFETPESLLEKTAIDEHVDIHLNAPLNLEKRPQPQLPPAVLTKAPSNEAQSKIKTAGPIQKLHERIGSEKLIITTAVSLGLFAFLLSVKQQNDVYTPSIPATRQPASTPVSRAPSNPTPPTSVKVVNSEKIKTEFNAQEVLETYDPYKEAALLSTLSKLKTEYKRTESNRVKDALEIDAIDATTAHYNNVKKALNEKMINSRDLAEEQKEGLQKKLESQLNSVTNREKLIKARLSSFLNGQTSTPF
ncbi:MAG: FHA domain-containing protein [Bdellovibrionota bacterium]